MSEQEEPNLTLDPSRRLCNQLTGATTLCALYSIAIDKRVAA
jgi:hypothetical protein